MRYEADYAGVWSVESDEFIEAMIFQILSSKGIEGFNSNNYITNIVKVMRHQLIERKWCERSPKELLPFKNGVLDIATGKLLPHSPKYRLTWQLPREHDLTAADWPTIDMFLNHLSGNNTKIKELLICYCNAVLKGRHDLQKFLHLIGLGGTGKGTFSRLITALIGEQNIHTTTIEEWCANRFEGANAYRKRLVLFPDEDKQTGKLGKFLSLTGEDLIRAEEKGKKAFQYRYDGMVLVLSNFPIFTGDSASRVKRRVIPIPCNNQVSPLKRRNLEAEFESELAAFTNYILNIPDEKVTRVLMGIEEIPECTLEFWENRIRVDSIAAWLNQHIIYDPLAETAIGSNRNEGADGSRSVTLFGSYNVYCRAVGSHPKSHTNFSPDLIELCHSVLGWKVKRKSTNTGKFIRGLRLRQPGQDDDIPTHDYTLLQRIQDGDGLNDDPCDDLKPNLDKTFDEGDDFFSNSVGFEKTVNIRSQNKQVSIKEVVTHPSPTLKRKPDKSLKPSSPAVNKVVTDSAQSAIVSVTPVDIDKLPVPQSEELTRGVKVFWYCVKTRDWYRGEIKNVNYLPTGKCYSWEVVTTEKTTSIPIYNASHLRVLRG